MQFSSTSPNWTSKSPQTTKARDPITLTYEDYADVYRRERSSMTRRRNSLELHQSFQARWWLQVRGISISKLACSVRSSVYWSTWRTKTALASWKKVWLTSASTRLGPCARQICVMLWSCNGQSAWRSCHIWAVPSKLTWKNWNSTQQLINPGIVWYARKKSAHS